MKVMIRLYRQHDLDLIGLYYSQGFAFKKALKDVLSSYVRGKYYRIQIPMQKIEGNVKKQIPLHIVLNEKEDADVIQWIQKTTKGQRNSMIKNLFRSYVVGVNIAPYRIEEDCKTEFITSSDSVETFERKSPSVKRKSKEQNNAQNIADMILSERKEDKKKTLLSANSETIDMRSDIADQILSVNHMRDAEVETENVTEEESIDMMDDFEALMNSF